MDSSFIAILLVTLLLTFYFYKSIKIAREDQRFAVFRLGRFMGIKGPGLIYVIFNVDILHKLSIGDRGTLIAPGQARFDEAVVPVEGDDRMNIGSIVRIRGFAGSTVQIMSGPDQGRTIRCVKCGHEMTI